MLKYTSWAWNSTRANTTQLYFRLTVPLRCRPTIFGARVSTFDWTRAKRSARDYAALPDLTRPAECDFPTMKAESHLRGLILGWDSTAEIKGAKALKFLKSSVDFFVAGSCPTRMRRSGFLGFRIQ